MSNYNTQLQSNNTDLQTVLQTLQTKAAGGEQATPVISVNSATGLITATAGAKSATHQLAFQPAQTIIPGTTNQTIPANTYLGGTQTIKGDANLVASNIVSGKSIFGVVGTATAGGSSGDTSIEDRLVNRTLTSYTNDRITTIGGHAFHYCRNLTSVNFPEVTTIGEHAFEYCLNLSNVSFPVVRNIGGYAFYECLSLTSVNFPEATTIGEHVFERCSQLTSVSFPKVTTIGYSAFHGCSRLTSVNFPEVTTIRDDAFKNCKSLTNVSFPKVTTIGEHVFERCSQLTSVSFPKVTAIGSFAFYYCSKLQTIYLGASTICTLANKDAFSYTSIWSTKGSIFVPTSLVASYKAATNWAYFSKRIFGI